MPNQSINQSYSLVPPALPPVVSQAEKQLSIFFINREYGYVQLRFSTKKALTVIGGAGLMIMGKLNPELFDVIWALLF